MQMDSRWLSSDFLQGISVFERSKIEMIIMIAMFRIGNEGRQAVHFDAMMREFDEVKDTVDPNGKLGALGPSHVWGCFLSLLTANVLKSRLSRYSFYVIMSSLSELAAFIVYISDVRCSISVAKLAFEPRTAKHSASLILMHIFSPMVHHSAEGLVFFSSVHANNTRLHACLIWLHRTTASISFESSTP